MRQVFGILLLFLLAESVFARGDSEDDPLLCTEDSINNGSYRTPGILSLAETVDAVLENSDRAVICIIGPTVRNGDFFRDIVEFEVRSPTTSLEQAPSNRITLMEAHFILFGESRPPLGPWRISRSRPIEYRPMPTNLDNVADMASYAIGSMGQVSVNELTFRVGESYRQN